MQPIPVKIRPSTKAQEKLGIFYSNYEDLYVPTELHVFPRVGDGINISFSPTGSAMGWSSYSDLRILGWTHAARVEGSGGYLNGKLIAKIENYLILEVGLKEELIYARNEDEAKFIHVLQET